jgi:hypothetical protein
LKDEIEEKYSINVFNKVNKYKLKNIYDMKKIEDEIIKKTNFKSNFE